MTDEEREALIKYLAQKFEVTEDFVQDEFREGGDILLLAMLDPYVLPEHGCPECHENRKDALLWNDTEDMLLCTSCGNEYVIPDSFGRKDN